MSLDADIAVVGLGAIGAMAAWRLAHRGVRVHGYERFGVGHHRGASAGQTRRFSVQSQRDHRFTPLAVDAFTLWQELEKVTGRRSLEQTGGLILGPADSSALASARESAREHGLDHEWLDAAELARRFPQHRARDGDAGVLDPYGGFLRPELSVVTAVGLARELGAAVFDYTRVLRVEPDGDCVLVHTETGSRRYAGALVAPGPWAGGVVPALRAAVLPRRLVQAWYLPADVASYRPEVFPVFERVGDVNAYGFPTVDGATIKIGVYTSGHPIVYDIENPPLTVGLELVRHLRDVIGRHFPGVHPDPVTTAVALEGYTTDGLPLLGPSPDAPRIVLACGFSGTGFKFAPVMGDIAAEYLVDGGTSRDVDFLSPKRSPARWPPETRTPA